MSRYLKEVHKCQTPEILPSQNIGTIWECDCKLRWIVSPSHYTGELGWAHHEKWKFNEAEDRLLTQEEILDYLRSESSPLIYTKQIPSLWDRLIWRFKR